MIQSKLEALCAQWQKILRLQDWNVTVRLVRRYDMNDSDAWGECDWNLGQKTATIRVLDPQDVKPTTPYDPESVLVHELVHLHVAPFRPASGSMEERLMEQAINCLEGALISLSRGGGAPDAAAARVKSTIGDNVVDSEEWRKQHRAV